MNLDGARILVAGGAQRVGRAIALDLARAGADVAVSYHTSNAEAELTHAEIAALGRRTALIRGDATRPEEMRTMVEEAAAELGGLDGYVHTPSGGFRPIDPQQIDPGLWDLAMDSTAKGFLFASQAAFAAMLPNRHGVIVAVNDVAARQPWPRFAHHAAAKAAQAQLIKCLAAAWGQDGIRVCGVAPGPVLMPEGVAGNPDETALRRLGSPDDVAGAIRYLFEAEFVTGTILVVDGGRLLRP